MYKLISKSIKIIILSIFSLLYLAVSIYLIFLTAYLFGHPILDGGLPGNDSIYALGLINWFDRFYPHVPLWYPIQGMGVSMYLSYPFFPTFLILFIKHVSQLSAIEVFRILAFLEFPLTAMGIYFLGWSRLKNQTIGLIAALFFLISQASWLFQTLHGIFAQSFSFIFVPWVYLFYDIVLERVFQKGKGNTLFTRLAIFLAGIFLALTFLSHVLTAAVVVIGMFIWALLRSIFISRPKSKLNSIGLDFLKSFFITGIVVFAGFALSAFWVLPFNTYNNLANIGGFNNSSLEQVQQQSLTIPALLGIGPLGTGEYRYDFFFFAAPVLLFFVIGIVMSLLRRDRKMFIISFVALSFFLFPTMPIYLPPVASAFSFFFGSVYFRGLIPALILLPLAAAWGVWSIPSTLILTPFKFLTRFLDKSKKKFYIGLPLLIIQSFLWIVVSLISLGITYWSIQAFGHVPEQSKKNKQWSDPYGPSLSKDYESFLQNPLQYKFNTTQINVNKGGLQGVTDIVKSLDENLALDDTTIIDVSPYAAGGAVMQAVGLLPDKIKTINLYHYQASLIHGMWGYQQGVFYGKEPLYKSANLLGDLTDWFGLKYALIVPNFDPFDKYKATGWTPLADYSSTTRNWGFEVWENPASNGIYSATRRPVILAIGNNEKGFYDQVFRSANLGALPYKKAWIVQGNEKIDDYSLDQLEQFNGIILQGYSYNSWNKGGAWSMLQKYLEQGGNVFVDTGWQYVAKDWSGSLPEPLPVAQTAWSDIGDTWDGLTADSALEHTNFSQFDPPVWDASPWGMSLARKQNLRDGSKILLSKDDNVLMASREVGKGKIVWSGINIMSHITRKMNEYEALFLGDIFSQLFTGPVYEDYDGMTFKQENTDTINIHFSKASNDPVWFLLRQSYAPYWKAALIQQGKETKIATFNAGPGFVLLKLPPINPNDQLNFSVKLGFKDGAFATFLSIFTVIFLILFIPFGNILVSNLFKLKKITFMKKITEKMHHEIKSFSKEDEDY